MIDHLHGLGIYLNKIVFSGMQYLVFTLCFLIVTYFGRFLLEIFGYFGRPTVYIIRTLDGLLARIGNLA